MVKIYENVQNKSEQPDDDDKKLEDAEDAFDKYIHLTDSKDIEGCNQNFLVYTLTGINKDKTKEKNKVIKKEKKHDSSKSSDHSEGSKSPRTSHLFKFVSKLKKNRMEGKQIQESTEILLPPKNIDLKSSSKIPVHLKRRQSKVNLQSRIIPSTSEFGGSSIRLPDPVSVGTSRCSSLEEICVETSTFSNDSTTDLLKSKPKSEEATNMTTTSNTESINAPFNRGMANNLQEVTEEIKKLQESEKYICDTLAKYINDQSYKIELKESVTNYIKQHIEAERKAQHLSHKIWEQQIDLRKSNEIGFKNTIDNLVKKNRKLLDENDALNKKNEVLSSKSLAVESTGVSYVQRYSYVVEGLNRANDKLRFKLSAAQKQIETIDNSLQTFKKKNNTLEDQIRKCNWEMNQNKDILRRSTADNELELTNLNSEIKNKTQIIQTNSKSVKLLVEDLNNLKTEVKCLNRNADINIIKETDPKVSEVISITRSCLKELHKEVQTLQAAQLENQTKLKQLSSDHNSSLDRISELEMQCDNLRIRLKQKEELIINNFDTEETVRQLRQTLQVHKNELENKTDQIKEINEKYADLKQEKQNCDVEIGNLEERVQFSAIEQESVQKDNSIMKLHLQELNNLLFTSGTANISRDLNQANDQLGILHDKCAQLELDKKSLNDKIHQQELERQTLTIYQDNCYNYFQELQKEVEKITLNNELLKTKLEEKKDEISGLQAERKRNLEEKEVLRKIYEKLKEETTKVVELEGTVTNINKEAVRLAKIAEYNKHLGDKLKSEVVVRDEEIYKLKNNLDKLNGIQEENVKEKVSLCEELTEICNWKDVLDNKLAAEVQRNMMLAEYKSDVEITARRQIEMIEEKYLKQSNELDMLGDKYRSLEAENEHFKTQLQIKEEKVLNMESRVQHYNSDYESAKNQLDEAKNKIADHNIRIDSLREELNDVTSKLQFQISSNQKLVLDLENKIMSDSKELENMDRTIQYLQNNMQKMQNDLDKSRDAQKEQDLIFEKEKHKNEILQLTLEQKLKIIEDFENERQKELRKIDSLTCAYNKLSSEYEADIKKASNEQKVEKEYYDEMKQDLIEKKCEIKNLKEKIEELRTDKNNVQDECSRLQKQIQDFRDVSDEIETKTQLLSENIIQQNKITNNLEKEREEFEKLRNKYNELKKKTEFLRKDLRTAENSLEHQKKLFKSSFDELEKEFTCQKDVMYKDLLTMHDRVKEISADYVNQRNARVKYEEAHKALAEKLLKSVKMLVEEKISRQTSENKILELTEKNAILQREEDKNREIKEMFEDLKEELKEEQGRCKILSKRYNEEKLKKKTLGCVEDQENGELKKLINEISSSVLPMVSPNEGGSPRLISRQRSKLLTKIETYKISLEKSHKNYMKLQEELGAIQEKYTILEFQKSEMVLRLHETQVRLGVHENMVLELKEINRNVLTLILQMREDGTLDRVAAETVIFLMRS